MPCEYDCCECGVHVVAFQWEERGPPVPPLCMWCLHMPGWHQIPEMREALGRGYENLPPIEPREPG